MKLSPAALHLLQSGALNVQVDISVFFPREMLVPQEVIDEIQQCINSWHPACLQASSAVLGSLLETAGAAVGGAGQSRYNA